MNDVYHYFNTSIEDSFYSSIDNLFSKYYGKYYYLPYPGVNI